MKVVAISGSVRPGNFTSKALALVADELTKQQNVELELFDPRKMRLALPGLETDDPGCEVAAARRERGGRNRARNSGVPRELQQRHQDGYREPGASVRNRRQADSALGRRGGANRRDQGLGALAKCLFSRGRTCASRRGIGRRRLAALRRGGTLLGRGDRTQDPGPGYAFGRLHPEQRLPEGLSRGNGSGWYLSARRPGR